jgi:cytochrome c5
MFVFILLHACGPDPVVQRERYNRILALSGNSQQGQVVYEATCQRCHGEASGARCSNAATAARACVYGLGRMAAHRS